MKRLVCKENQNYGFMGDTTDFEGIYVGDIVLMTKLNGEQIHSVVCEQDGRFFVYGWKPISLEIAIRNNRMEKVHDYSEVTTELLRKCKHLMFVF